MGYEPSLLTCDSLPLFVAANAERSAVAGALAATAGMLGKVARFRGLMVKRES